MGGAISRITKLAVVLALPALLAFGGAAPAADDTVSWWHDGCGYSASFDATQHDGAQVRNTVHLLYGPPDFKAPSAGLPFNPKSVARINLDHVAQECRSAQDVAGRLEFLPLNGIEEYRLALMEEIKDTCAFEIAGIRGFKDPSALRDYQPAAACTPFADALEGKRDMMETFRQFLDHHCAGADQAACVEREMTRAQKEDGGDWMRLYLVKYGWSQCASEFTSRQADGRKLEQMRAGLADQFQHAFKVSRHSCEAAAGSEPELRSVPSATLAEMVPGKDAGKDAGKPASPPALAERLRSDVCVLKPGAHGRRSEAEKALCAAGHALVRSAARTVKGLPTPFAAGRLIKSTAQTTGLPTPFAADRSKQDTSYGMR
jgi:hypothetical protein